MSKVTASWKHIVSTERLQRSSQTVSVTGDKIWIFGGELQPREPVDSQLDVISIGEGT